MTRGRGTGRRVVSADPHAYGRSSGKTASVQGACVSAGPPGLSRSAEVHTRRSGRRGRRRGIRNAEEACCRRPRPGRSGPVSGRPGHAVGARLCMWAPATGGSTPTFHPEHRSSRPRSGMPDRGACLASPMRGRRHTRHGLPVRWRGRHLRRGGEGSEAELVRDRSPLCTEAGSSSTGLGHRPRGLPAPAHGTHDGLMTVPPTAGIRLTVGAQLPSSPQAVAVKPWAPIAGPPCPSRW